MDTRNKTTPDNGLEQNNMPPLSERLALVRAYQQQALARPDPLAANLGMIGGDMMSFAHVLAYQLQTQLAQGAVSEETRRRFAADMELYLRVVRQSDRLTQIERQLGAATANRAQAP